MRRWEGLRQQEQASLLGGLAAGWGLARDAGFVVCWRVLDGRVLRGW